MKWWALLEWIGRLITGTRESRWATGAAELAEKPWLIQSNIQSDVHALTKSETPQLPLVHQEVTPLPVVQEEVAPPPPLVTESVQRRVDSIVESEGLNKLRYFLMEIIRKNTGIPTPNVTVSESIYSKKVSLRVPGKYKSDGSIPRILINHIKKTKTELVDDDTIKIWNFHVKLDSGYLNGGFSVEMTGKVKDDDLESLRDFFEKVFLSEFMITEETGITTKVVRQILELWDDTFVHLDDKNLEVAVNLGSAINIDGNVLDAVASVLNNVSEEFSVKFIGEKSGSHDFRRFTVQDIQKQLKYKIAAEYKDGRLTIWVSGDYSEFKLDRKFLETIMKRYIYLLSESTVKKKSTLQKLRDMGVIVYEKNPEEPKKTLEALYDEEWFVWYEDVKDTLAKDVIFPWENRDAYIQAANEEFPHMKNIIPNTALFEGPPGTGKTTQAKIIGKYLGYPFIYIPIGKLMSKWYGESEGRLDAIFELARKAAEENGGIIVMIDEIDEIWKNRDDAHEATGRMTWVLLKKLDGIEQVGNLLLIGSTNRKDTMDPALLSRFSQQMFFRLPDTKEIQAIFSFYIPDAAYISHEEFASLEWKSGRDIKNMAESIARKYLQEKIVAGNETVHIRALIQESITQI